MSQARKNLQGCQIVEELSANDGFVSYRVTSPDIGPCRLLLAHPHARLAVKGDAAFFDRAEQLSQLGLPGAATVLDAGFYQERVACLLPLCEGLPLYEYAARPANVGDRLLLVRTLVDNLAVAHARGICHGNLTPALILVDDQLQPLLCDFALSQLFVLDYNSGVDPRYCSPEQVRGEVATPASDIYNLGCILYRLLTGNPPYHGKNNFSIATRHLEGDFPELPESFAKCSELLAAMVRLTPSQRSTAPEVLGGLEGLLVDQELIAVPCGQPEDDAGADFAVDDEAGLTTEDEPLSSISSKVEALLRDQQFDVPAAQKESVERPERLDPPVAEQHNKKTGEYRRYVILLLVGILIGMSAFLGYSYWREGALAVPRDLTAGVSLYPVERLDESLKAWQDHNIATAEDTLSALIAEDPDDPRAYNNLAALYASQGKLEKAGKLLVRGLGTNQDYLTMHQNLGEVYAEMARESYGKALQLSASDKNLPLRVFSSQGLFLLQRDKDSAPGNSEVIAEMPAPAAVEPSEVVSSDSQTSALSPEDSGFDGVTSDDATSESEPTAMADEPVGASVESETAKVSTPVTIDGASVENLPEGQDTATEDTNISQIREFLESWAASWTGRDVERYLSFYGEEFIPAGGLSRPEWVSQRRRRLQVPGEIQITLSDIKIADADANGFTVEVMQSYQSPRYSDVTRKQFELLKTGTELKIISENALEIMR